MEYFDLDGLTNYQLASQTTYKANSSASEWFYNTREKLKYLVKLLSEKTGNEYKLVYTEKPNGQAGQGVINFKDYVLAGFSVTKEFDDDLFMKVAISNIKESPVFDLNIDMNFKKKTSYFQERRNEIFKSSYVEWDIDDNFPSNWNELIELIIEPFEKLETTFRKYISELQKPRMGEFNEVLDVLEYKKQIILQGPPGTGKTRLAKHIASELTKILEETILEKIKVGLVVDTVIGEASYTIKDVDKENEKIVIERTTGTTNQISFQIVIDYYNQKRWLKDVNNSDDRMAAALAKYLFDNFSNSNDQIKIIQFHPSYSYEDFVRGITAKPNPDGEGILYEAENKSLGTFAKLALENRKAYLNPSIASLGGWIDHAFDGFLNDLAMQIEDNDERLMITKKAYITRVSENSIRYNADAWEVDGGVPFTDIKKMYEARVIKREEIVNLDCLTKTAKHLPSYWLKVYELFKKYLSKNNLVFDNKIKDVDEKKYVLIIDEINRANLSSVLGELIYALEYRGDEVESMYEVDGSNKLILPPNLYIIGTMNTADRSVGHIDYAIRRRFAFVDVLPEKLSDTNEIYFNTIGFEAVEKLFIKETVSGEFEVKDVQLGHSYFIAKKRDAKNETERDAVFKLKMDYEIKPILREYVKDGILLSDAKIGEVKIKDYIENL